MGLLARFLFRHMKGLRGLVILAMIITVLQVSSDIFAAFPLKFIPSKVQNVGNDPECLFPFLGPIESWFDIPQIDPSLQPEPQFAPGVPPIAQCPVDPNDPHGRIVEVAHSTIGVIVFSVLMLIIFGLLSALLAFVDLYLAAYIGQRLTAKLRNRLFEHLQGLSLGWHGKQQKGDLVQRVAGNVADIEKLVTDGLVDLLAGVLTLLGVTSVMLFLSVPYTLIAMAIAPALFIMVLGYTKNIKAAAKKAAKATGQLAHVATEDINALILIKVFTREMLEAIRFGNYVENNKRERLRAGWLQAQFTPLVALLVILGTAAVVGVGGYVAIGYVFNIGPLSIAAYSVDAGTLVLFLTFLKLLYQPMRDLSKLATLASTAASGAERIQEVLDQALEVKEVAVSDSYTGPERFRGEITFENVVMGYLPGVPVLRGIDLHISPGQKVGLVGLSGSGKTTLARLIPRFYNIQEGTIQIDGVDNRLYPLDVLRKNVSMVLQDSVLFEGTIRENIAFGRPGASIEDIVEAAKKAYIHDMITSLSDGYDTHVSEQGENFSGGEKQRIAIARAILRDAPILLLDEPTAALDVEAETEVMRALSMLMEGRTVLTISHRLSTLGHVDEILVMQGGQIVERGTYKELKRQKGVFAGLLEEQNRYNLGYSEDENETLVHSASAPLSGETGESHPVVAPLVPISGETEQLHSLTEPIIPTSGETGESYPVVAPLVPVSSETGQLHSLTESIIPMSGETGQVHPLTAPFVPVVASVDVGFSNDNAASGNSPLSDYEDGGGDDDQELTVKRPPEKAFSLRKARVLVEMNGQFIGEYQLDKPTLTLGRRPTNDIQIPSQSVSRVHALIRWKDGAWVIEDARSLNGLSYHGQPINHLVLVEGDRVFIAATIVLQYNELPEEERDACAYMTPLGL